MPQVTTELRHCDFFRSKPYFTAKIKCLLCRVNQVNSKRLWNTQNWHDYIQSYGSVAVNSIAVNIRQTSLLTLYFLQYEGVRKRNEQLEKELKLYKAKLAEKINAIQKADMFLSEFPPIEEKEDRQ